MYRVIAIICASLALTACDSNPDWMKTPDWLKAPDWSNGFKWDSAQETVRVESEPPGAEARASNGKTCRTPCALDLPGNAAATVTFTLAGYQTDSEKLDLVAMGDGTSQLRPNPVVVELTPLPPAPKPTSKKKPAPKKKTAATPVANPATAAAPPPMSSQPQQSTSPWPTAPQR